MRLVTVAATFPGRWVYPFAGEQVVVAVGAFRDLNRFFPVRIMAFTAIVFFQCRMSDRTLMALLVAGCTVNFLYIFSEQSGLVR